MAILYRKAKPDLIALVVEIMTKFHGDLAAEGVSIGCLVAANADGDGPALKHHGYPAIAVVKITPYKQRVQGIEDAVITFDADAFARLSDAERRAVVDHELYHLQLQRDEMDFPKRDDMDRPKLKARLHDFEIGGFTAIMRRHGIHAIETQAVRAAYEELRQMKFDWASDVDPDGAEAGEDQVAETSGVPAVIEKLPMVARRGRRSSSRA